MAAAAAAPTAKVLVVGPPAGQIHTLLSKVNAIHAKHGPFDALLILGDVFAPSSNNTTLTDEEEALLHGTLACTIPTYFSLGSRPLPAPIQHRLTSIAEAPAQLAPNLFYLGHAGVTPIPTAAGSHLNLAFIGGKWDPAAWSAAPLHASQNEQAGGSHHITPTLIHDLLQHPALALSKPIPRKEPKHNKAAKRVHISNDDDNGPAPTTLAQARAQQAAKLAALARSTGPTPPGGLVVVDEDTEDAVDEAEHNAKRPTPPAIDILMLPCYPAGILNPGPAPSLKAQGKRKAPDPVPPSSVIDLSTLPHPSMPSWGAPPLANVVARARPRYVFALGPSSPNTGEETATAQIDEPSLPADDELRQTGTFFERAPYINPPSLANSTAVAKGSPPAPSITRFISLAKLANPKRVRWFMALNLPLAPHPGQQQQQQPGRGSATNTSLPPPNATPSPYGMLGFERVNPTAQGSQSGKSNGERSGANAGSVGATKRWPSLPSSAAGGGDDMDAGPNFRFATSANGAAGARQVPPRSYVCRLCNQPGHYIQDCELASGAGKAGGGGAQAGSGPVGGTGGGGGEAGSLIPPDGYECRICLAPTHRVQRCPFNPHASSSTSGADRDAKRPRTDKTKSVAIPVGPKDCWFCLSNPACAKHLIVGVGSECYVALPKGQLVPALPPGGGGTADGRVPGGGHVLIVPITHTPSYLSTNLAQPDQARLLTERSAFQKALAKLYAAHGCLAVSWEVGRAEGATHTRVGHTHTQVVPVPRAPFGGSLSRLGDALEARAREAGYELVSEPGRVRAFFGDAAGDAAKGRSEGDAVPDYFRLEVGVPADGEDGAGGESGQEGTRTFLLVLRGAQARFNMQWPRQALASILNTPERADWRVCARATEEEEREEAEQFKAIFQPYAAGIGEDDDEDYEDDEEEPDAEGY